MEGPREDRQGDRIVVHLEGRLDDRRSAELFQWATHRLQDKDATGVVLDLGGVSFINTAGIALLRELEQCWAAHGKDLRFENLPATAERFLDRPGQGPVAAEEATPVPGSGGVSRLGKWVRRMLSSTAGVVSFIGRFISSCRLVLQNPRQFKVRDFLFHIREVGTTATVLICAINGLTGMILVFQGEAIASKLGSPIYVANMVARSITAQMGPVLTAILIAGRTGTAFAAKIGTMKVRQELEVLEVMNFNIFTFLVLPRVLAVTLATPLLTMLADASGILGGMLTGMAFMDLSPAVFTSEVMTLENIATRCIMLDEEAKGIIASGPLEDLQHSSEDPRVQAFFRRRISTDRFTAGL